MGNPYTAVTVQNYNANPPADDGSQVPANRLNWSKHIDKIGNPLKEAIEDIDANVAAAIAKMPGGASGIVETGVSYEVTASDQGKLIVATASGITITTPDATVVGAPFLYSVLNNSSGSIVYEGNGSQTINDADRQTMKAGESNVTHTNGTEWFAAGSKFVLPPRHIFGLVGSNNVSDGTNDLDISSGSCRDALDTCDIVIASNMTKRLDADWAAGTNQGMRYSGQAISNVPYHIFAISNDSGSLTDIFAFASTDPSSVLPTGYTKFRRIFSILRESNTIVPFTQDGDYFLRKGLTNTITASNPGTSAVTRTLAVPTGLRVRANFLVTVSNTGVGAGVMYSLFTDLDASDDGPGTTLSHFVGVTGSGTIAQDNGELTVRTNASGQIRSRVSFSDGNCSFRIWDRGWWDDRGKSS